MPKALRVLQVTTVSNEGDFRSPDANERRLRVLDEALKVAAKKRCDLVQLPAGFFAVTAPAQWRRYVEVHVAERARRSGIAVVGGVDADDEHEKSADLPYYGFVVSRTGTLRVHVRQRSSRNPAGDPDKGVIATKKNRIAPEQRIVRIGAHRVALVVCGEQHNPWSRDAIRDKNLTAVLVCGHEGLGQGLVPAIQAVAKAAGCHALHVQHLRAGSRGAFHHVDRQGIDHPAPVDEVPEWRTARWSYAFRNIRKWAVA